MPTQLQRREQIATEELNRQMGTHYRVIQGKLRKWDAEELFTGEKLEHKTILTTTGSGWVIHPPNFAAHKHWCFSIWKSREDSLEEDLQYMIYLPQEHVEKFEKFMEPRLLDRVKRNKQNDGACITKGQLLRLFDSSEITVYDFRPPKQKVAHV